MADGKAYALVGSLADQTSRRVDWGRMYGPFNSRTPAWRPRKGNNDPMYLLYIESRCEHCIYSVLKAGVTKAPPRTIEYRSYKHFDTNSFKKDLEGVPWHLIENEDTLTMRFAHGINYS